MNEHAIDRAAIEAARRLGIVVVAVAFPNLLYAALMNVPFAEAAAVFGDLMQSDTDDMLSWQGDPA